MLNIGEQVVHKAYGLGTVVSCCSPYIEIEHNGGVIKKYILNDSFRKGFLTAVDEQRQEEIIKQINTEEDAKQIREEMILSVSKPQHAGNPFLVTADRKNKIGRFREENYFLSNMYSCKLSYKGLTYLSSEAAFQAQKCTNEEDKIKYTTVGPKNAKKAGRLEKIDIAEWNKNRVPLMTDILRAKFSIPELREKLLATGNAYLEEGNSWGDTFWGVSEKTGEGSNRLGRILMEIRMELQNMEG